MERLEAMNVGMLWLDSNSRLDIAQRIQSAAAYYRKKYGKKPNVCVVHPAILDESMPSVIGSMEIRSDICILKQHFWLGVEEEKEDLHVAAAA